jgi:DNA (cytosine-5)-methyltransferase 1
MLGEGPFSVRPAIEPSVVGEPDAHGVAKLRVLSLFAGIGGFDLGLERTGGFETVAFCEIDPFCRRVLAKHWPEVPCYDDVRSLTAERLAADGITIDAVAGGFPCQDLSHAGKRGGLEAERSGLWFEYRRLVRELRPCVFVVENTPGLLSLGMGTVLGDLAALGYDAQWDCIPANRVGAPHERDRVWIVAYPNENGLQERMYVSGACRKTASCFVARRAADGVPASSERAHSDAGQRPLGWQAGRVGRIFQPVPWHDAWPIKAEPVLGRGADGVPDRLDRVGALGNAVVPQIPELIGNAILASMGRA